MSEDVDKHVLRKYHVCQKLGKGAYGIVWKAFDRKTNDVVALKKIFDAFQNSTDAQRTFREVMFLQEINDHENVIKLTNVLKAENDRDLYLVFEYMETDLHAVIRANILEDVHKQYIMYQLFKSLKYLHSAGLLHRDIKPSNLLLDSDCRCKLADFGLARSVAQLKDDMGQAQVLTDYVATRWYRAPEILLGSTNYTFGVDMWSSGCILGELLNGKPVFPGASTMNQIEKVLDLIGKPASEDIAAFESPFAAAMIENMAITGPRWERIRVLRLIECFTLSRSFRKAFPSATPEAADLLRKLLHFNPQKRLTAEQALQHPYVAQFHNPREEPSCNRLIRIPIDDNHKFTIHEYRERLYAEIISRKKEIRKKARERERSLHREMSRMQSRRSSYHPRAS
ncbi:extracellular signal-regulated kinase 2 isoform X1 [Selaginella moellendorffii]|uniref:extracellular signal-regulated kinase 2 isoform X1 n=1 Tax=Selaginella moellendorffii TaxID=88036 RepID=UPI000D1C7381|nr:extracellular signal-regulated kinase 2 isoform X1 [Selaginella moellendorffii]|eukprot:XP_024525746.1 extracellular signal-regulated kinase 2 isoform X1 [Selaginella moellendorffii]